MLNAFGKMNKVITYKLVNIDKHFLGKLQAKAFKSKAQCFYR